MIEAAILPAHEPMWRNMSRTKPKYEIAPDGLPARRVGRWVERKDHYVDRFATIFANGMKNKWPSRGYIELFAGPGESFDRARRIFVPGSAIRALDRNFTHFAFVDIDPIATTALRERIRVHGRETVAPVFQADCNAAVHDIRAAIPPKALSLAFIDPTNWQVRLSTVEALVKDRQVDLLMTFHAGGMRRMEHMASADLDAFFGTNKWRNALKCPRWQRVDALLGLYNRQLEPFGYLPSSTYRVPVKNSRNVAMYELVVFSKNPRGIDFWRKTIGGDDESGQRSLWDGL
jgi:three-Cys-motif partner protein